MNECCGSADRRVECGPMSIAEQIRGFVADRFLFDPAAKIDPAQSLMKSGILDSTGAMELVMFLETTFTIRVADSELVPQNLDTIAAIEAFVQRKAGATA